MKRFAAAIYDTARWENSNQGDTAQFLAKYSKLDVQVIRGMTRAPFADAIRASEIQPQLDVAFKYGMLARPVAASESDLPHLSRLAAFEKNGLTLGLFGRNCSSGLRARRSPSAGPAVGRTTCVGAASRRGRDRLPASRCTLEGLRRRDELRGRDARVDDLGMRAARANPAHHRVSRPCHAPLVHPIFAAKQFVTADQVGRGRFALNIVAAGIKMSSTCSASRSASTTTATPTARVARRGRPHVGEPRTRSN